MSRIVLFVAALCAAAPSVDAARVCRTCAPIVAAPVIKAATFAYTVQPIVTYQVAEPIQQRAQQQWAMETAPEYSDFRAYQEFRAYEAWKAGRVPGNDPGGYPPSQQQNAGIPSEPPAQPPAQWPQAPGATPPAAPGAGSPPNVATPNVYPYAARIPLLVSKCAACHGGTNPDGGLFLDGQVDLLRRDAEGAQLRDAIVGEVVNGRMPKATDDHPAVPLNGDEMAWLLEELYLD